MLLLVHVENIIYIIPDNITLFQFARKRNSKW